MGSNYPPGVNGSEYPIAGPDWMREAGTCPRCAENELIQLSYRGSPWFDCSNCGYTWDGDELPTEEFDRWRCLECGELRLGDDRVRVGMKCGTCTYERGETIGEV